jgi:hypothetical protein
MFDHELVYAVFFRTALAYAVVYWRKFRRATGFAVTDLDVRVTEFGRHVQTIERNIEASKHPPQP